MLAHAKTQPKSTPAPASATSAAAEASALAQVQAIFSYCELVDPRSAGKYERVRKLVLSGNSSEIGNDERSSAYRTELGVMAAALGKVPVSTGINSCRTVIAGM
jgi:hypothetical protein